MKKIKVLIAFLLMCVPVWGIIAQVDTENADRDLTSMVTVLTDTPDASNPIICQGYIAFGDGSKNLNGTGGLFEFTITVGGQTIQPNTETAVFGTEIRSAIWTAQFPVPANKEVIMRAKSPNGADTDVDVTAYLYDVSVVNLADTDHTINSLTIDDDTGNALTIISQGGNGHAAIFTGNGSGEALKLQGGATGHGFESTGGAGATGPFHGMLLTGGTAGDGLVGNGTGGGQDINFGEIDDILADTGAVDTTTKMRTFLTGADTPVCKDSTPLTEAEAEAEAVDALESFKLDELNAEAVTTSLATAVHDNSIIGYILASANVSNYVRTTDSLEDLGENIADILADTAAIDTSAEWLGLLSSVDTTATSATHATTYITITAGKASNDAYNGQMIAVTDADDSNTETRRIEDYTSARKVTFDRAMSFTPADGDVVRIYAMPYNVTAAVAGGSANTYIVTDTGAVGGTGIADVSVWVTADSAGARLVVSGVTDSSGEVVFYLDAGTTYYVWMAKSGYSFSDNGEAWIAE